MNYKNWRDSLREIINEQEYSLKNNKNHPRYIDLINKIMDINDADKIHEQEYNLLCLLLLNADRCENTVRAIYRTGLLVAYESEEIGYQRDLRTNNIFNDITQFLYQISNNTTSKNIWEFYYIINLILDSIRPPEVVTEWTMAIYPYYYGYDGCIYSYPLMTWSPYFSFAAVCFKEGMTINNCLPEIIHTAAFYTPSFNRNIIYKLVFKISCKFICEYIDAKYKIDICSHYMKLSDELMKEANDIIQTDDLYYKDLMSLMSVMRTVIKRYDFKEYIRNFRNKLSYVSIDRSDIDTIALYFESIIYAFKYIFSDIYMIRLMNIGRTRINLINYIKLLAEQYSWGSTFIDETGMEIILRFGFISDWIVRTYSDEESKVSPKETIKDLISQIDNDKYNHFTWYKCRSNFDLKFHLQNMLKYYDEYLSIKDFLGELNTSVLDIIKKFSDEVHIDNDLWSDILDAYDDNDLSSFLNNQEKED